MSKNTPSPESAIARLRAVVARHEEHAGLHDEPDGAIDDLRFLLDAHAALEAQVAAARAFVARNTEPVEDDDSWSAGYADALDDLLTAMKPG